MRVCDERVCDGTVDEGMSFLEVGPFVRGSLRKRLFAG